MSRSADSQRTDRVRRALAAQRGHLRALVRRQAPKVDADEVVQVAAERALTRAAQVRDPARTEAWVARIARNVAADAQRGRGPALVPLDDVQLSGDAPKDLDCWCVLAQAASLKPEYAEILRCVDVDGVAVTTVAGELGLSSNNAMVRLHRARKALRERMADHCGTTSARSCSDCGCEERGCCTLP